MTTITEWQTPLDYGETWIDQELEKNGMQYIVNREPLTFDDGEYISKDYFWTYRVWPDGTREPIAPVGSGYRQMQNRTVFDFLNVLAPEGEIEVSKIKDYRRGKAMIVEARLPEEFQIAGEYIERNIYFLNGHDGHTVAGGIFAPERRFCSNILTFPASLLGVPAANTFRIKHTSGAPKRLESVLEAIQNSERYYEGVQAFGERLAAKRAKTRDFERFLKQLVPIPPNEGRGQTLAIKRQEDIRSVWRGSENLNDIRFTKWGFLQGVVEWNDHNRTYRDENVRFDAIFRGRNLYRKAVQILEK